ncbi:MAG: DUF1573 domain-containing protein [Tissierellales bacterium]|nr:DUF1573 domain-containing protein [Tissierellales bacterium]
MSFKSAIISIFILFITSVMHADALVFDTDALDLGEIIESQTITKRINFKNASTESVEIIGVKASCGCTIPKLDKMLYSPEEIGFIDVTFNSSRKFGRIDEEIYVFFRPSEKPKAIKITGNISDVFLDIPDGISLEKLDAESTKSIQVEIKTAKQGSIELAIPDMIRNTAVFKKIESSDGREVFEIVFGLGALTNPISTYITVTFKNELENIDSQRSIPLHMSFNSKLDYSPHNLWIDLSKEDFGNVLFKSKADDMDIALASFEYNSKMIEVLSDKKGEALSIIVNPVVDEMQDVKDATIQSTYLIINFSNPNEEIGIPIYLMRYPSFNIQKNDRGNEVNLTHLSMKRLFESYKIEFVDGLKKESNLLFNGDEFSNKYASIKMNEEDMLISSSYYVLQVNDLKNAIVFIEKYINTWTINDVLIVNCELEGKKEIAELKKRLNESGAQKFILITKFDENENVFDKEISELHSN